MRGERSLIKEISDGFAGEGGAGNFFEDDAGAGGATERDGDEVTGLEVEVGSVSKGAGARAENFSGYYLIEH